MEICAIICEFNPFHNGHKYLIEKARELSGCDAVACIMSGSFTQRGDVAIMDKFTRAAHAVKGGADCVIELPTHFSVAPAEIFASGAVKILASIPQIKTIAFGCEELTDFMRAAKDLHCESEQFKRELNKNLAEGMSYAKSYSQAYSACGGEDILSSPNNILAAEYAKAVSRCGRDIRLLPVKRVGGYLDGELKENYSSASAIRNNINDKKVADSVPDFVYKDLLKVKSGDEVAKSLDAIMRYALLNAEKTSLKAVCGCGEGLENRLKKLSSLPLEEVISLATGKRYTSSRIRRILISNALNLKEAEQKEFLKKGGYIKPLAVNREKADVIFGALAESLYPTVIKKRDLAMLDKDSKKMFALSEFSDGVRDIIFGENTYNYTVKLL